MVFTVGKAFFPAVATLGAIQLCCPMAVSNDNREFSFKKRRPYKLGAKTFQKLCCLN